MGSQRFAPTVNITILFWAPEGSPLRLTLPFFLGSQRFAPTVNITFLFWAPKGSPLRITLLFHIWARKLRPYFFIFATTVGSQCYILIFLTIMQCYIIIRKLGRLVKRLRRSPLTAESGVRFPYLSFFFAKN